MSFLKQLLDARNISPLSYYFAEFIVEQSARPLDSLLGYSAVLVSEANQRGDVCILLKDYAELALFTFDKLPFTDSPMGPPVSDWCQYLTAYRVVGEPGDVSPLILEDGRLYLYRYWYYETKVANSLRFRLEKPINFQADQVSKSLGHYFPGADQSNFDEQRNAVALSIKQRVAIVSGGPGTGKTTTVLKILSVLLSLEPGMRIQLAAPTGKAAARLMESIRSNLQKSGLDNEIQALLPKQAKTIHRLLGYRKTGFRHNQNRQLAVDCVVVDEASMIDLKMMFHLLEALPDRVRIILLGDRDQLASVASGNVLGDMTGQGLPIEYSDDLEDFFR